jgi:hypothetical protein
MVILSETVRVDPRPTDSNLSLQRALAELAHADACARSEGCNPWEFAVEIEHLLAEGLTSSDLRWLVKKGFVEHACEVTRPRDTARRFQSCCNVGFPRRTCFLLTEAGTLLATAQGPPAPPAPPHDRLPIGSVRTRGADGGPPLPTWDRDRRILRLDGRIVKQFKVPSPTQEAVLAAFDEEGWPAAIDDPLPPHPDQDPKRRLRNTIQHLNANQKNPLLCFRGDGSGERVLWERAEPHIVKRRLSLRAA